MNENRIEKIFNLENSSPEYIAEEKQKGKELGKSVIDRSEYFVVIAGTGSGESGRFEIKMSCAPQHVAYIIGGMTIALNALVETHNKAQKNIDKNMDGT